MIEKAKRRIKIAAPDPLTLALQRAGELYRSADRRRSAEWGRKTTSSTESKLSFDFAAQLAAPLDKEIIKI